MAKRENEGKKRSKKRKEDKEKTRPGFITKPNISIACAYARVRGDANRLHLLVRGGGRSGDGEVGSLCASRFADGEVGRVRRV